MFNEFDKATTARTSSVGVYNAERRRRQSARSSQRRPRAQAGLGPLTSAGGGNKGVGDEKGAGGGEARKENAEMKAKLAATGGGDAKALDDEMKRKRKASALPEEGKEEKGASKRRTRR